MRVVTIFAILLFDFDRKCFMEKVEYNFKRGEKEALSSKGLPVIYYYTKLLHIAHRCEYNRASSFFLKNSDNTRSQPDDNLRNVTRT